MEGIRGTHAYVVDANNLAVRIRGYHAILVDIGTGDGRYIRHVARTCPAWFAIGIDACRENLRAHSRNAPDNALFVIANARALPTELHAQATRIIINFPWGSLLEGLLAADSSLFDGLIALARPHAKMEMLLNAGALAAVGWPAEAGIARVQQMMCQRGFMVGPARSVDKDALRAYPSTWAKRLVYGRAPQAWRLPATYPCSRDTSVGGAESPLLTRQEETRRL